MQLPDLPYTARVEESLAYLAGAFDTMTAELARLNEDAAHACQHTARLAAGGKHLRPQLTHIACDRPAGQPTPHADVLVAAAFDMLHCAFLLVDDVLDDDDLRRGVPTLHATARERATTLHGLADGAAADHYGRSVAVLAGMAAQNHVTRIILDAGAPAETTRHLLSLITETTGRTITGEFMDIHHSLPDVNPDKKDVEITNRLKTSTYSFEAPLIAGRILHGPCEREEVDTFAALGRHLGAAYQIADDIGSVFAPPSATGKTAAGDVIQGRATLLMGFAATTDTWPAIAEELRRTPINTTAITNLLRQCGAHTTAHHAATHHLEQADDIIRGLSVSGTARRALHAITHALRGGLNDTLASV